MQNERLKSPQKSRIIENQAFWVILAKTAIIWVFGSFSRVDTPTKKPHVGSCLNQQDRATCGFSRVRSHGKPGKKNLLAGVSGSFDGTMRIFVRMPHGLIFVFCFAMALRGFPKAAATLCTSCVVGLHHALLRSWRDFFS